MSANPNWDRWIFASLADYFTKNVPVQWYVEGEHRTKVVNKDYLELRIDGPYYTEESYNYWYLYLEVSVLVQAVQDDKDSQKIRRLCGQVASAFTSVPVYKYGKGILDDSTLLGCLTLIQDTGKRERIQTNHFGLLAPDLKLMQSTVEGHYSINLSN